MKNIKNIQEQKIPWSKRIWKTGELQTDHDQASNYKGINDEIENAVATADFCSSWKKHQECGIFAVSWFWSWKSKTCRSESAMFEAPDEKQLELLKEVYRSKDWRSGIKKIANRKEQRQKWKAFSEKARRKLVAHSLWRECRSMYYNYFRQYWKKKLFRWKYLRQEWTIGWHIPERFFGDDIQAEGPASRWINAIELSDDPEKQEKKELSKSVIHYMPPTSGCIRTEQCKKQENSGF